MSISLFSPQLEQEFKINFKNKQTIEWLSKKALEYFEFPPKVKCEVWYKNQLQDLQQKCNQDSYEITFTHPIKISLMHNNKQECVLDLDISSPITELTKVIKQKNEKIRKDYTIKLHYLEKPAPLYESLLFMQENIFESTQIRYQMLAELIIEFEQKEGILEVDVFWDWQKIIQNVKAKFFITSIVNAKFGSQDIDFQKTFYATNIPNHSRIKIILPEYVRFQMLETKSNQLKIVDIAQTYSIEQLAVRAQKKFGLYNRKVVLSVDRVKLNPNAQICSLPLYYMQKIDVSSNLQQNVQVDDDTNSSNITLISAIQELYVFINYQTKQKSSHKFPKNYQIGRAIQEIEEQRGNNCKSFYIYFKQKTLKYEETFQALGVESNSQITYYCLETRIFYEFKKQTKSIMVNENWTLKFVEKYIKQTVEIKEIENYTIFFGKSQQFQDKKLVELGFGEIVQKLLFLKTNYELVFEINYQDKQSYSRFSKEFDHTITFQQVDQMIKERIHYTNQTIQYFFGYHQLSEEEFIFQIQEQSHIIVNVYDKLSLTLICEQRNQNYQVEFCPITPFETQLQQQGIKDVKYLNCDGKELKFDENCLQNEILDFSVINFQ